jgi:hypothetical protein
MDIVGGWRNDQVAIQFRANGDVFQDIMLGSASYAYTGTHRWITGDRIRITMKNEQALFAGYFRVWLMGDTLIFYTQAGGLITLNPS